MNCIAAAVGILRRPTLTSGPAVNDPMGTSARYHAHPPVACTRSRTQSSAQRSRHASCLACLLQSAEKRRPAIFTCLSIQAARRRATRSIVLLVGLYGPHMLARQAAPGHGRPQRLSARLQSRIAPVLSLSLCMAAHRPVRPTRAPCPFTRHSSTATTIRAAAPALPINAPTHTRACACFRVESLHCNTVSRHTYAPGPYSMLAVTRHRSTARHIIIFVRSSNHHGAMRNEHVVAGRGATLSSGRFIPAGRQPGRGAAVHATHAPCTPQNRPVPVATRTSAARAEPSPCRPTRRRLVRRRGT